MEWFFIEDGKQVGPIRQDELIRKISVGKVSSNQLAWNEGVSDWQPISSFPELQITSVVTPTETSATQSEPTLEQGEADTVQSVPTGSTVSQPPRKSGLAIASICLAAGSMILCGIFMAVPAIICGHMALGEIKRSKEPIEGKTLAIIGLVLGYLITFVSLVIIVFWIFFSSWMTIEIQEEFSDPGTILNEDEENPGLLLNEPWLGE